MYLCTRKGFYIEEMKRRKFSAWLLLSVFVPMLLLSSLHRHAVQEEAECAACGPLLEGCQRRGRLPALPVSYASLRTGTSCCAGRVPFIFHTSSPPHASDTLAVVDGVYLLARAASEHLTPVCIFSRQVNKLTSKQQTSKQACCAAKGSFTRLLVCSSPF